MTENKMLCLVTIHRPSSLGRQTCCHQEALWRCLHFAPRCLGAWSTQSCSTQIAWSDDISKQRALSLELDNPDQICVLIGPCWGLLLCYCTLSMDKDGKIISKKRGSWDSTHDTAWTGYFRAHYCHDKYVRDSKIWLRGTLVQIEYILREVE